VVFHLARLHHARIFALNETARHARFIATSDSLRLCVDLSRLVTPFDSVCCAMPSHYSLRCNYSTLISSYIRDYTIHIHVVTLRLHTSNVLCKNDAVATAATSQLRCAWSVRDFRTQKVWQFSNTLAYTRFQVSIAICFLIFKLQEI